MSRREDDIIMTLGDYVDLLMDKKVVNIGRIKDIIWIDFKEITDEKNAIWRLDIQATCRIVNAENKEIILASSDIFQPNDQIRKKEDFNCDFDWKVPGNNLFDEKAKKWLEKNNDLHIKESIVNLWGDLRIIFSNGDRLEVYVNTSEYVECWRLLEKNRENKIHLVITGLGWEEI